MSLQYHLSGIGTWRSGHFNAGYPERQVIHDPLSSSTVVKSLALLGPSGGKSTLTRAMSGPRPVGRGIRHRPEKTR